MKIQNRDIGTEHRTRIIVVTVTLRYTYEVILDYSHNLKLLLYLKREQRHLLSFQFSVILIHPLSFTQVVFVYSSVMFLFSHIGLSSIKVCGVYLVPFY